MCDAFGLGVEARGSARQVGPGVSSSRRDPLGVEDDEVGMAPLGDHAPLPDAVQPGRHLAQLVNRLFQSEQPAFAHCGAEQGGRVGEGIDHVEMGAGIGAADHGSGIRPALGPDAPALVVVPRVRRA